MVTHVLLLVWRVYAISGSQDRQILYGQTGLPWSGHSRPAAYAADPTSSLVGFSSCFLQRHPTGFWVWAPADFWAFDSMRRGPIPKPCHHQRRTLLSKSSDLSGPQPPPHQIRIHHPPMRRPRRLPLHQNPRAHFRQRPGNANLLRHTQISPPPDRDTLRW